MVAKVSTPGSKQVKSQGVALRRALEPRILFDAAIASTYGEIADSTTADTTAEPPEALLQALTDLPAQPVVVTEVVFVDSGVEGANALVQSLQAPDRAVYLLDASAPGLEQISRLLSPHSNLASIHIVSHGADGRLVLGSQPLTSTTLQAESARLAAIGNALSASGDILLYGCDIAQTAAGQEFVQQLSALTGADVAASNDRTGATGDWDFEYQTGIVETAVPDLVRSYQGDLALEGLLSGTEDGDAGQADQLGYAVDGSGEWVVAGGNGTGEVQVWQVVGNTRIEQKLALPSGASVHFGKAVSIEGSTLVVADPNLGGPSDGAGSAGRLYIYRLTAPGTATPWTLAQTLDIDTLMQGVTGWAASGSANRIGGWANASYGGNQWLAISGDKIAVGAPNEGSGSGMVMWFNDRIGDWSDTSATGLLRGYFNEPNDAGFDSTDARFGASVALTHGVSQGVLAIGAPAADLAWSGDNHGAVFIYTWSSGGGPVAGQIGNGALHMLTGENDTPNAPSGYSSDAYFGAAVDIEYFSATPNVAGSARFTIVAGAPGEGGWAGDRGEVYIYQTTTSSIADLYKDAEGDITTSNINQLGLDRDHNFGLSVGVSQGRVVVGGPNDHGATSEASVHYMESINNVWTGMNTTFADLSSNSNYKTRSWAANSYTDAATDDQFGRAIAFTAGNNLAIGAPQFDPGSTTDNRGRVAFYFVRTPVAVNDTYTIGEDALTTTFNPATKGTSNDIYGTETDASVTVTPIIPGGIKGTLIWAADSSTFTYTPKTDTNNSGGIDAGDKSAFEYLSVGQSETFTISYKLTENTDDGVTFSTTAQVKITVTGVNDNPLLDAGINTITVPRQSEPNGDPNGTPVAASGTVTIPINAFFDIDQADILTYSATAITQVGGTAVTAPNITSTGHIRVSGNYNKATGVNSGAITYNLGDPDGGGSLAALGTAYQNTSWQITVQVSDGQGGTATTTFVFNIARDNQNPETQAIPTQTATEDVVFNFKLDDDGIVSTFPYFRDPDTTTGQYAESLTYSLVTQSGPGANWLSVSPTGVLSGAASNENVGTHSVTVRATDIFGYSIDNTFSVVVNNTNDAPELINAIDRKVSIKGETFTFNVNTGVVTWANPQPPDPTFGDAGPYFTDPDNSTLDGRTPVSPAETISYRAYNAVTGKLLAGQTPLAGETLDDSTSGSSNYSGWLSFDGTSFSGTSAGTLGSVITVRLVATDSNVTPLSTSTVFEIGIFPRDGSAAVGPLPATPEYAAQLGYDVAINSGTATAQGTAGRWAVVGEPGSNSGNGRIRIYENTNYADATLAPAWAERATYTTTIADARLGTSVDISADGTRVVAGAPMEGAGAVYYFHYGVDSAADPDTSPWEAGHQAATPVFKVVSPDPGAGDSFGMAVALNQDGTQVLVGAPLDDAAGTNAGAAYLFSWGLGTAAGKLMPVTDGAELAAARAGDLYGMSVAFDQNMVVVGAPRDDHNGKQDAGSAYVYSRTDTTQFAKLTKAATAVNSFDYFGTSVDVDSFTTTNDSVVVVVGAPGDDTRSVDAGAVYVFRSDTMATDIGNGGGLTTLLQQGSAVTAYDADPMDGFGYSVAVDANEQDANVLRMAVGSNLNASATGATYAYRYWSGSGWLGQRYLPSAATSPDNNEENKFGFAVDIAGSRFLVGAPDAERTGGASTPDLGTLKPKAGKFYSFGLKVGTTPPEVMPTSGDIGKVVGSDAPAPVVLGSGHPGTGGGAITGTTNGGVADMSVSMLDDSSARWDDLTRPVSDWRSSTDTVWRRHQDDEWFRHAAGESYADALLFDERTSAGNVVLLQPAKGEAVEAPAEEAPVSNEGKEAAPAEPVVETPVPVMLRGFSSQLELAQGARARDAQRLLSSLDSLAS